MTNNGKFHFLELLNADVIKLAMNIWFAKYDIKIYWIVYAVDIMFTMQLWFVTIYF